MWVRWWHQLFTYERAPWPTFRSPCEAVQRRYWPGFVRWSHYMSDRRKINIAPSVDMYASRQTELFKQEE